MAASSELMCQRCKSMRLYSFEADPKARAAPGNLPVVCRDCGLITIAGVVANFPPEFEAQAKSMAEAAANAGEKAVQAARSDPGLQIARYFAKVYRDGYMDGFWRALMFWRHNAKEGRLVRLRGLWQRRTYNTTESVKQGVAVLEMPETVYAEFSRLMELGADGTRIEDKHPSVS